MPSSIMTTLLAWHGLYVSNRKIRSFWPQNGSYPMSEHNTTLLLRAGDLMLVVNSRQRHSEII
jgi:hypothetical protein